MKALDSTYKTQLAEIAKAIQDSELLTVYLDEEEDDQYKALIDAFESQLDDLHQEVAKEKPLQLVALEKEMLNTDFEGLYLPKLVGYTVLRGAVNDTFKYIHPQEHFKAVLEAMANSSNFDQIRKRTGQSIQVGFACSSDIWVTNFLNKVNNKKIKTYFESLKNNSSRDIDPRKRMYLNFQKQFSGLVYDASEFPKTKSELKILNPQVKKLILARIGKDVNNTSIVNNMVDLLNRTEFHDQPEYLPLLTLFSNFYETGNRSGEVATQLNAVRKNQSDYSDRYFDYLEKIYNAELPITPAEDEKIFQLLDKNISDDMLKYYTLMHAIHTKGYVHDETIEQVKEFYYQHEGLSTINECLRLSILSYFDRLISNIEVENYTEYFDINKIFNIYINIFSNQEFNQTIKKLSLRYIRKLLKRYTDKRGRDYQDIKKFITATFLDLGFMSQKELTELFKTKRKKKVE